MVADVQYIIVHPTVYVSKLETDRSPSLSNSSRGTARINFKTRPCPLFPEFSHFCFIVRRAKISCKRSNEWGVKVRRIGKLIKYRYHT